MRPKNREKKISRNDRIIRELCEKPNGTIFT